MCVKGTEFIDSQEKQTALLASLYFSNLALQPDNQLAKEEFICTSYFNKSPITKKEWTLTNKKTKSNLGPSSWTTSLGTWANSELFLLAVNFFLSQVASAFVYMNNLCFKRTVRSQQLFCLGATLGNRADCLAMPPIEEKLHQLSVEKENTAEIITAETMNSWALSPLKSDAQPSTIEWKINQNNRTNKILSFQSLSIKVSMHEAAPHGKEGRLFSCMVVGEQSNTCQQHIERDPNTF